MSLFLIHDKSMSRFTKNFLPEELHALGMLPAFRGKLLLERLMDKCCDTLDS